MLISILRAEIRHDEHFVTVGTSTGGAFALALAAAVDAHGEYGSKTRGDGMAPVLAPSDLALFG
jgi:hypothetical protein